MSGAVLVMLVSGCDRECSFDHVLANEVDGAEVRDCGDLPAWDLLQPAPDPSPWRAAHDCVIEAATLEQPFVVRWRISTIEGHVQVAFVAQGAGDTWSIVKVSRNVSAGGKPPPTVTSSCSELLDQGTCTNVLGTLCVECGDRSITDDCVE